MVEREEKIIRKVFAGILQENFHKKEDGFIVTQNGFFNTIDSLVSFYNFKEEDMRKRCERLEGETGNK